MRYMVEESFEEDPWSINPGKWIYYVTFGNEAVSVHRWYQSAKNEADRLNRRLTATGAA